MGRIAIGLLVATLIGGMPPAWAEPAPARQKGVSWVGGREPISLAHLEPLRDLGVNWIVQTPFGWQKGIHDPEVHLITGHRVYWGETDEGLETTARLARELKIRTLLKPHIWLHARDGSWRGQIAMQSEEDWSAWFATYRRFLLHYARLAERIGIEALCIGTELHGTISQEQEWRRLIQEVRKVFRGQLTYAANWNREFQEVPFWDALDFIGIQAYFPLTGSESPTLAQLKAGWAPWLAAIERVQQQTGKPVLFTEIGYRSTPDGAIRPWEWPSRDGSEPADPTTQARGYQAFFETFWGREWVAGAYFWKWYPAVAGADTGRAAGFTPQGKPAQNVLSRWYRDARAVPPTTGE